MSFSNPYNDDALAAKYAKLGIDKTYYLAYRDVADVFREYGMSGNVLDYGCGTGRSTRFLRDHGFSATGVDISEAMIKEAREQENKAKYRLIKPGDLTGFTDSEFDLVLSMWPFDSIATVREKTETLMEIARVLKPGGWAILVASSPEIYKREWVSFSSSEFPENKGARDGDKVKVFIKEASDRRVVEDILCTEATYEAIFRETPLMLLRKRSPLAAAEDSYQCDWISELSHAPWMVFILKKPKNVDEAICETLKTASDTISPQGVC